MFLAKELFQRDAAYSAWAGRLLLDASLALPPTELEKDLGASHSNILATLGHICDAERVWLDCLTTTPDQGEWRLPPPPGPRFTSGELKACWPKLWAGYRSWLNDTPEEKLEVRLTIHLPNATSPQLARWQILRHALDHSTFHRGQIVGMIRSLGRTPPAINRMDFILSSDEDPAAECE